MFVQTCLPGLDEQPDLRRAAGTAARSELRAPTRLMAGMCGVLSSHGPSELVSDLHVDDELYFSLLASLNSCLGAGAYDPSVQHVQIRFLTALIPVVYSSCRLAAGIFSSALIDYAPHMCAICRTCGHCFAAFDFISFHGGLVITAIGFPQDLSS